GIVHLEMNTGDFGIAQSVATALNAQLGAGIAQVVDGRVVRLNGPMDPAAQADFLSRVENIQVTLPPARAKVIINARTGSVVMNRTGAVGEAAAADGKLAVIISQQAQGSQPATPCGGGQTVVAPSTQIEMRSDQGAVQRMSTSANLADVVRALNAL